MALFGALGPHRTLSSWFFLRCELHEAALGRGGASPVSRSHPVLDVQSMTSLFAGLNESSA
jgi:hypothetical protein